MKQENSKKCTLNVNYTVKGQSYQDDGHDINTDGIFIMTKERFYVGDVISLTISHSSLKRPIKISGEVVRIESDGVGVKFKKRSQVQTEILKAAIRKVCDSDLPDNE